MSSAYDACPVCNDDRAVLQREDDDGAVYQCASCKAPLRSEWMNEDAWTLTEDWADV